MSAQTEAVMAEPRLHHYVPQFYLKRFRDASGRLYVWDRDNDRVFTTGPRALAAEQDFYHLDVYAERGHDPTTMERQLASLEHEVSIITGQWIDWIRDGVLGMRIPIPDPNRELVSLFIALQFLRTRDTRDILAAFASVQSDPVTSERDRRVLHTEALWDDRLVEGLRNRISTSSWVFGRNSTAVPFVTSDNPVAFRAGDNSMWLKTALFSTGTYVVYPLSPDVVMYCYPHEAPWLKVASFDGSVSPIEITDELVGSENSAQVFMASRFVISNLDDFSASREFARTIGTDAYAPFWQGQKAR
jgi:hypothetical protein